MDQEKKREKIAAAFLRPAGLKPTAHISVPPLRLAAILSLVSSDGHFLEGKNKRK